MMGRMVRGKAYRCRSAWLDFDGAEEVWQSFVREPDTRWEVHRASKPGLVLVMIKEHPANGETWTAGSSRQLMPRTWLGMKHREWPRNPSIYFMGIGWGWPCKALWCDYVPFLPDGKKISTQAIPKTAITLPMTIDWRRLSPPRVGGALTPWTDIGCRPNKKTNKLLVY